MSTQGVIKTLFSDKEKTEALFPRTKLSAVSAEDGTGLNAIIDDLNAQLDTKATESFVTNKIAEAQLNSGGDIDLSGYATKDDLNSRVPTSRTVNGKALSSNVTLSASDVKARPNTWTPTAADVGARPSTWNPSFLTDAGNSSYRSGLQYSGSPTKPLYMAVWDADDSATGTQPNRRVRSIEAEGARALMGAAPAGFGLGTTTPKAPNDDPNQITKTGFYSAQHANLAPGSSGRAHILHIECTSNYAIQFQYDLDTSLQAVRRKLAGVWQSWKLDNPYTLPAATSSTLGGVKVGSNITNSSGTISLTKANVTAALGYTPAASASAGMIREFNSGAINVSPNTGWAHNGIQSKIYIVTLKTSAGKYTSLVFDYMAVERCGNTLYLSTMIGTTEIGASLSVSTSTGISITPKGASLVHVCGYY